MEYDILQGALDNFNELDRKLSADKKDRVAYVYKKTKVISTNEDETFLVQFKNLILTVSRGRAYTPFDIIDENTGEVLYKDMTPEIIKKRNRELREILLDPSIHKIDTNGDGIKFVGREDTLDILEESFHKKRMKNTILIGNAGCGKTKIIQELTKRLSDKYVFLEWRIANVVSNTALRGMLEEKVERTISKILRYNEKNEAKIILFIDEIHCIMGGLSVNEACQSVSIQDMLKPYLTTPNLIVIGATTPVEYKKAICKDKAFKRRLCPIYVESLSKEVIMKILLNFSENKINESLVDYIYEESLSFKESTNPDISLEIIDRVLSKKEIRNIEVTKEVIDSIIKIMKANENVNLEIEEE
ncbi:MAG: AAA family ATPase [Bacilli bacterium]